MTKRDIVKQLDDREETRLKPFVDQAVREILTKPKTIAAVTGCIIRDNVVVLDISTFVRDENAEDVLEHYVQNMTYSAQTDTSEEQVPPIRTPRPSHSYRKAN